MNKEDAGVLRSERDASPRRFSNWDPHDSLFQQFQQYQLFNQFAGLSPEVRENLQRQLSDGATTKHSNHDAAETRSISSVSSADSEAPDGSPTDAVPRQLEAIRTARMSRSETRRINRAETHPTALDRIQTARTQHSGTVGAGIHSRRSSRVSEIIPLMGAGKQYPPDLPEQEEYVVEFDGFDDPRHAQNWSSRKKVLLSAMLIYDALAATVGSSIFSNAVPYVDKQFHVGQEVGTLGVSFFVLGYAFGPVVWAPMSELYGRRIPLLIGGFGFSVFAIAVAVAKDLQTVLICRFFDGLFGSCPLAVVAAAFADMYGNKTRGLAIACFSASVFMGPLLAPFIGGFISQSYLGWRWTEYISAINGFSAFACMVLFFEETYPPMIMVNKAAELRRKTRNWGIHAKQEEIEVDFKELLTKNITRPLRILFTEPIVLLVTIYMAFLYGILYLFLTAYDLVFQHKYGMNQGVGGLPYFGMVIGEIGAFLIVLAGNKSYVRKLERNNNIPVPEWRLPIAVVGGFLFAGGLFWFGWTGYKGWDIPWIVPTLSGLFTGFGIFAIFLSLLNYLVDAYVMFAASAIAANTILRSLFGAVFPLFATYMFDGMGIEWASTLLGCVAALMIPLPVIFLVFGSRIRGRSKFAPAPDLAQDKRRKEEEKMQRDMEGMVHAIGSAEKGHSLKSV